MSSDPSTSPADSTGIFEVFRVGSVPYESLLSQDFDSVKQKYLLVVPISSKDQLKKDSCLAVIPPPSAFRHQPSQTYKTFPNIPPYYLDLKFTIPLGHMIVDQTKFRQLVAKQAVDLSAKRTTEVIKRSEATIEKCVLIFPTTRAPQQRLILFPSFHSV
jgi:hypothetical protein